MVPVVGVVDDAPPNVVVPVGDMGVDVVDGELPLDVVPDAAVVDDGFPFDVVTMGAGVLVVLPAFVTALVVMLKDGLLVDAFILGVVVERGCGGNVVAPKSPVSMIDCRTSSPTAKPLHIGLLHPYVNTGVASGSSNALDPMISPS